MANIETFAGRDIDPERLAQELAVAGFTCRIEQTDRAIENGILVLETRAGEKLIRTVGADGRPVLLDARNNEVRLRDAQPRKTARYIRLECNETIDRTVMQRILDAHDTSPTRRDRRKAEAQAEAARREQAGVAVGAVTLSTDTDGIARLHGLMVMAQRREAAGLAVDLRGRTEGGERIVVTSAAKAEGLFDAASAHLAAVQAALDTLYARIDAMPSADLDALDVADPVHWP